MVIINAKSPKPEKDVTDQFLNPSSKQHKPQETIMQQTISPEYPTKENKPTVTHSIGLSSVKELKISLVRNKKPRNITQTLGRPPKRGEVHRVTLWRRAKAKEKQKLQGVMEI